MKSQIVSLIVIMLLLTASVANAEDAVEAKPVDTTAIVAPGKVTAQASDPIVISYLHMNRRCMTCGKLEAYSEEAISSGFEEQLKDSSIVWRVLNFEEDGNEHYAKNYQLYSQSLIVSRLHDGKEIEWKNLDKIWELVRDKDAYIAYVQAEVKNFMKPTEEE